MKLRNLATTTFATIALTITASGREGDAVTAGENADKAEGIKAPSIEETKAFAEEGFIYGLPIVMNYAVMNKFAIDKNSGQFKAPFNSIFNDAKVFTYKDTAVFMWSSATRKHPMTRPITAPGCPGWTGRGCLQPIDYQDLCAA